MPWAIKRESNNQLDGHRVSLLGGARFGRPPEWRGYTIMVFKTRAEARVHIREHYGYMAKRPDLRREPHGWKAPKPVKVAVSVKEVMKDE